MAISPDAITGIAGVVTGSVITGGVQYWTSVRSDRREARRARRLIRSELQGMLGTLRVLETHGDLLLSDFDLKTPEWDRQRDTLALGKGSVFGAVSTAYASCSTLVSVINMNRAAQHDLEHPPDVTDAIAAQINASRAAVDRALRKLGSPNAARTADRILGPASR
jgi:regulator of protease activity HflC (stomatin/prohibitin superfamily)